MGVPGDRDSRQINLVRIAREQGCRYAVGVGRESRRAARRAHTAAEGDTARRRIKRGKQKTDGMEKRRDAIEKIAPTAALTFSRGYPDKRRDDVLAQIQLDLSAMQRLGIESVAIDTIKKGISAIRKKNRGTSDSS